MKVRYAPRDTGLAEILGTTPRFGSMMATIAAAETATQGRTTSAPSIEDAKGAYITLDSLERIMGLSDDALQMPDSRRSPLRYPGGKSRAVSLIRPYIPADISAICAPFLGGGSVELDCAADGIEVHGSDAFDPLINFWQLALENPVGLASRVVEYQPVNRTKFYHLQKSYDSLPEGLDKAAVFFILNRSSFSGTTLSGGMSPGHPRFTSSAIQRLRDFRSQNLQVSNCDYKDALREHADKFLYLDPPYANGEKLYGNKGNMHEGFDHEELAAILHHRDGWVLSYNDSRTIRRLYQGRNYHIVEPGWMYGMSGDGKKRSRELLIINA